MEQHQPDPTTQRNYLLGRLLARLLAEEEIPNSAGVHDRPNFHPVMLACDIQAYCKRGEWHKMNSASLTKRYPHALTRGRGLVQPQPGACRVASVA